MTRRLLSVLALSLVAPAAAPAADQKQAEQRSAAGRCASPAGTLFRRPAGGRGWEAVRPDEEVFTGDLLMALPGDHAVIDSKNGAVRLTLWGNVPAQGGGPVLESVVRLGTPEMADLDVTLARGRIVLAGRKDGPERVRVHFARDAWDVGLTGADAAAALERYGRWQPGTTFNPKPGPADAPATAVTLVFLKGQGDVSAGGSQHGLQAPPGPASFRWNSLTGAEAGPRRLDQVPAWARGAEGPAAVKAAVERRRQRFADKSVDDVLAAALAGDDEADRDLAVYGLAAVGDLGRVVDALTARPTDVRTAAARALRHWLGGAPDHSLRLYELLMRERGHSARQAETVVQLLYGFDDATLDRPETYAALIAYLQHPKATVRELARAHLYRLVPAGKDIAYDPNGSAEERDRASTQWKKLIPDGKLPPEATERK